MHPFPLERPRDLSAALALRAQSGRNDAPVEYIAGGTDMVQLLQENVRQPERLVSLAGLLDNRIEVEIARAPAWRRRDDGGNSCPSRRGRAVPAPRRGAARLCEPAGAQSGDGRGQSIAAHPLPVFP